jgi:formylglycine-generating enzyme required for sulfatase activity
MRSRSYLLALAALLVVPVLPVLGVPGGGKDKEDALIAAMKFVKVPKGTFWMGGGSVGPPTKRVEITEDFELAAYTVTQEEWQAVMGNNPSYFSRQGKGKDRVKDIADADLKRFPVETVSWNDVQEFLKKLNEQQKGKSRLYRLPTEMEWEYACRGASSSKEECFFDFYFDKPTNDLSSTQANFRGGFPAGKGAIGPTLDRPTKLGSYAPNKLGLYDMHGNMWQWCQDLSNPTDPGRVIRGGSWCDFVQCCRAAFHFVNSQSLRSSSVGFRLARVTSASP